ncbi:MAG: response regulator [Desulfobulbaceae bacterium]|nr:response regulator [Desulfobulbaceae bacterium]
MNKHILVVDDNTLLADMVGRWLRINGYAVTTAYSGGKALSFLELNRYDLILCDIHMDGKDGFAVLAACKAMHPKAKVIMCSGDTASETVSLAFHRGADSFLAKPFMIDELWHQVGLCLDQGQQESDGGGLGCHAFAGKENIDQVEGFTSEWLWDLCASSTK